MPSVPSRLVTSEEKRALEIAQHRVSQGLFSYFLTPKGMHRLPTTLVLHTFFETTFGALLPVLPPRACVAGIEDLPLRGNNLLTTFGGLCPEGSK